ncbi:unnamed protein product [Blepharisma stoltei]|uniref:Uncharacterized protein n=1 Tax=Blepharisma stoltei TaxID=1481888 RepID=A0AAU9JRG8_9CILI|nr:unnamed protein product [Blepharisma stoltei]
MGCQGSRAELSDEERVLLCQEAQLNYAHNNCKTVDFCKHKYSAAFEINAEQWRDIVSYLSLNVESTAQNPKAADFFTSLKNKDGKFPLRIMLVLGAMLSQGSARDKAKLLFETRDPMDTKELHRAEIHALVAEMVDIAINKLTLLHGPGATVTEEKWANYVRLLNEYKDKGILQIVKTFLSEDKKGTKKTEEKKEEKKEEEKHEAKVGEAKPKEHISLQDFLKVFDEEENSNLLTPHGIRLVVLSQRPAIIKTQMTEILGKSKKTEKVEVKGGVTVETKVEVTEETHNKEKHHKEKHHKEKKEGSSSSSSSSSSSDDDKKKEKHKEHHEEHHEVHHEEQHHEEHHEEHHHEEHHEDHKAEAQA